jgi:glycosyltransferase involved in cell wall biosynthesis
MERRNLKGWVNKYLDIYEQYTEKYGVPDLIIAHSTIWAGYVASRIKDKHKVPYLLVEHRSRFARDVAAAQRMIREWYFPYIRSSLVKADKIITVSEAIDNQLISVSPGIRNKITTIPNLIDTDFFTLPEKKRNREPFIIISFGILEYVKGFDILIRAFAELMKRHEGEFFLRIGGRGTKYRKLRKLAKELGIGDRVSLHGYVPREEVKREMQLANLFVLPSRFEAFGVVLIEAMATGCPVISTYSGGPEYIVKESDGILVEPEDVGALVKAMSFIYENYEDYDPEAIRQDVENNYTKEIIRDKYHQIIKEIVNEKGISSK